MFNFNKVFISFVLMLLSTNVLSNSFSCENAELIISSFVKKQTSDNWSILEKNIENFADCKCHVAPIFYYIHNIQVAFPNSHALQGVSPNEHIIKHQKKMDEQIKILRSCNKKYYSPLITAMISQRFDDIVSTIAINLKKRLKK